MTVETDGSPLPAPDSSHDDDARVVRRVLDGDIDAFSVLVHRYHGRCVAFARRMLGDSDDADDAVQVAFVRAYASLRRYTEQSRFVAWLFQIVMNECRAHRAKVRRRERYVVSDDDAVTQAVSPERIAASGDDPRLERAIGRLDPLLREAFLLRHIDDLSYREMQLVTGAGESALKMRVKRAREALQSSLENR